ncbi:hypothetical protein Tco_1139596, partial [Tanacetum coccineum]
MGTVPLSDCPYVLLPWNGTRDSGPALSFDIIASLECMSGLACASPAEGKKQSDTMDEFYKLVDDLTDIETAISDEDQALLLITSLPSSYENFVETLLYDRDTLKLEDALLLRLSRPLLCLEFFTLCKQGHWFSFAKRRAPSPVCIDDNRSCMKGWKSCFFLIDQRAIPDYMPWRHPDSAIDDPKPPVGSYNQEDVRRLSAHVVKLQDMPEGCWFCLVWVRSGRVGLEIRLSRVLMEMLWVFMIFFVSLSGAELRFRRSFIMISGLPCRDFLSIIPLAAADVAIPDPTLEDLVAGTSNAKVMAKFESSKKRKALLSGAAPSHVAKFTRSAMAQSSGSTTRPNLFATDSDDESDDDEDAWNQGGGSAAPIAEGSSTRDSRGKGIMTDVAEASSEAVGRPRPSFVSDPSFRGLSVDAIHRDFFPFSPGPYYAAYPADGVVGNCKFSHEEWDAPHQPTLKVLTKEVFKYPAVCKTVVDQFPTPGEMVRI